MQAHRGVIVVTGVSGLIGGGLARALVSRGEQVLGLDRVLPADPICPVLVHELGDAHRLHQIMLTRDVRAIVHAGGASGPMVWPESPARVIATNIGGLTDVLEAARLHRVGRVIWFSSIAAYGSSAGDGPINEDTPLRPRTVYGATKAAGEALIEAYAEEHGVEGVSLRVASCYGPGRTTSCFIRTLLDNAAAGRPTLVADPDLRDRQHIFVADVVDATIAALDHPAPPSRAYNVGPGSVLTAAEVAAAVAEAIPGARVERDPSVAVSNSFASGPMEIGRAARDLGWRPRVSLADGAAAYPGTGFACSGS